MIDDMLRFMKALKADFRKMLKDESIPLEKRMEWFANYGAEFLDVVYDDVADDLTAMMAGYLEEGFTEEDVTHIKELLQDGVALVVR